MELENLNKTQIILLTLLVSFVTSIATGIVTVSLMEKAPADVTRVISRIVEKPIETIIPGEKEVVTQETTVVVREEEQIAQAVAQALPSIVRIYTKSNRGDLTFQGLGVIISAEGVVLTNTAIVSKGNTFVVALNNGTQVSAKRTEGEGPLYGFVRIEGADTAVLSQLVQSSFAPLSSLSLGQTVVAIGGAENTSITTGIVSEIVPAKDPEEAPLIRATVDSARIVLGSPLIGLDGRIVGIPTASGATTFTPVLIGSPVAQ